MDDEALYLDKADLDFLDPPVTESGKKPKHILTPAEIRYHLSELTSLFEKHQAILSPPISPDVVRERGYRSFLPEWAKKIGFSEKFGGGIAIPIYDKNKEVVQVQLRFDDAPTITVEGKRKKLRYLSPPGLDLRLDFPLRPLKLNEPILLTEGAKKADALRSLGLYAVALPGVWVWKGGIAKKDLSKLSFDDHPVIIIFDREEKPRTRMEVEKARKALILALVRLGAEDIKVVDLPEIPGQTDKVGVDDFIREEEVSAESLLRMAKSPEAAWTHTLIRSQSGEIRINHFNLITILQNDSSLNFSAPRFDEFRGEILLGDRPVKEETIIKMCAILEERYLLGRISPDWLRGVVETLASEKSFHPVRDWLDALTWDGESRIDGLFPIYFGSKSTRYTQKAGKNFLIASVARIYQPGCQHDHAVVLQGEQGIKKTSSLWTLFGRDYYSTAYHDLSSKDFKEGLIGFWVIEISELAAFRKSEVEIIKSEITKPYDDVRLAFRRDKGRYRRQCVFVGTTNEEHFLTDATGNRRFWPIRCKNINQEALEADRDQLWAEAVHRYKQGEDWWNMPLEEALAEQEERFRTDTWEDRIGVWLEGKMEPTTSEILGECLGIEIGKQSHADQTRVGSIMKRLGFSSRQKWRETVKVRVYVKND